LQSTQEPSTTSTNQYHPNFSFDVSHLWGQVKLKQVDSMLSRFGPSSKGPKAPKAAKAASTGKRTRRRLPKINDEEIKAQLSNILSSGKKVSSAVIFKEVGLARPRFTAFLKANSGFLHIEGKKRSTTYSLK
jgi:hypothetical protein